MSVVQENIALFQDVTMEGCSKAALIYIDAFLEGGLSDVEIVEVLRLLACWSLVVRKTMKKKHCLNFENGVDLIRHWYSHQNKPTAYSEINPDIILRMRKVIVDSTEFMQKVNPKEFHKHMVETTNSIEEVLIA